MKRKLAPLSIFLSLLLVFKISCPVFASSSSSMQYNEMYSYYFCEVYCGCDFSEYQNTDEGTSLYDYANEHGNRSVDEAIEYYENQMQEQIGNIADSTSEYYSNAVSNTADFAKNSLRNTVTTTANVNNYIGERVRRTVVDNGRKFFNVSGSDWFNSIYNDLFNNNGYNQQYYTEEDNSFTGTNNGNSFSIKIYPNAMDVYAGGGVCPYMSGFRTEVYSSPGSYRFLVELNYNGTLYYTTAFGVSSTSKIKVNRVYVSGSTIYLNVTYGDAPNYNDFTAVLDYYFNYGSSEQGDLTPGEGSLIPKPKSCGVINLNGDWVDVAVDPEDRQPPGTINPNGTFTDENGNDYDIYIEEPGDGEDPDPGQLSDPGVWQIIKTVGDTPFGNTFNDPNSTYSGDNSGDSSSNPFGLSIKDFFDNIGKGVGNALSNIFGGLIDLLKKVFEIIKNLFSMNYLSSMQFDLNLSFSFVTDFFNILLSILGVST